MATNSTSKPSQTKQPLRDLAVLFSVPVAIALIAASLVYVPRVLAHPKYDFIYTTCSDYQCRDDYSVNAGGNVVHDPDPTEPSYYNTRSQLYYYNATDDSSRSLTLEEADHYQLSTSNKSPDGYTLTQQDSSSGFLFWSDTHSGWYLEAGLKKKEVRLSNTTAYSSTGTKFLGWVTSK